jgi:hypothetical protein
MFYFIYKLLHFILSLVSLCLLTIFNQFDFIDDTWFFYIKSLWNPLDLYILFLFIQIKM